jgi:hypothetical protein
MDNKRGQTGQGGQSGQQKPRENQPDKNRGRQQPNRQDEQFEEDEA